MSMLYLKVYFFASALYTSLISTVAIWSLARVGKNYLFWLVVSCLLTFYLLLQLCCWYLFCKRMPCERTLCRSVIRAGHSPAGHSPAKPALTVTACRIILISLCLTLSVWWMERCSFFIFGAWEGGPFFQPLIFLDELYLVRIILQHFGPFITLFLLHLGFVCSLHLSTFHCFRPARCILFLCVVIMGLEFVVRLWVCRASRPVWLDRCCVIRPAWVPGARCFPRLVVDEIAAQFAERVLTDPGRDLIFLPESALPFSLVDSAVAYAAISALSTGRWIFLGTYRRAASDGEPVMFNAALCMADGNVALCHDKSHGMPGLERLPPLFATPAVCAGLSPVIGSGFFAQAHPSEGPVLGEQLLSVPGEGGAELSFSMLICSELFYRYRAPAGDPDTVIVALVNDAWFAHTPLPALLWRIAGCKACAWRRQILYISYEYAGLFAKDGSWFSL
ncbi:MAG: hypothetical protein M1549_03655 [Candidatus Dependentiae bacterium]|nr:hypothetical protein [Candidatus Dependentiae bacterium]